VSKRFALLLLLFPAAVGCSRKPTPAEGEAKSPNQGRTLQELTDSLRDADAATRKKALAGLAGLSPSKIKEAVPDLVVVLRDKNAGVRRDCLKVLNQFALHVTDTIPVLTELVRGDEDPGIRAAAAEILGIMGPRARAAVPALVRALSHPSLPLRRSAAATLLKIKPEGKAAVRGLAAALRDRDKAVRDRAAAALGDMGPAAADAVPALLMLLKEEAVQEHVARLAPGSLSSAEDEPTHSPGAPVVVAAAALRRIGPAAVASLLRTLKDGNPCIRLVACDALDPAGPGGKAIVPVLIEILRECKDYDARLGAIRRLELLGPAAAEAVPVLIALLEEKNFRHREAAISTLGEIGPKAIAAAPALMKLLVEREVSYWGSCILRTLHDIGVPAQELLPTLLNALDEDEIPEACRAFLMAYDKEGKAAVPALLRLLKDKKTASRAGKALKVIDRNAAAKAGVR
jgi:HEAT repeat protein